MWRGGRVSRQTIWLVTTCVAVPAIGATAATAPAGSPGGQMVIKHAAKSVVATTIGVSHFGREYVVGTRAKERVAGKVLITTPSTWTRTSHNTAPLAKFRIPVLSGCSAVVTVAASAVATRASPKALAYRFTRQPAAVIRDSARPRGWLRLVQQAPGSEPDRPDVYGIAVVRLVHFRLGDARTYAWFEGCSDQQIRNGDAASGLANLLRTAKLRLSIVKVGS